MNDKTIDIADAAMLPKKLPLKSLIDRSKSLKNQAKAVKYVQINTIPSKFVYAMIFDPNKIARIGRVKTSKSTDKPKVAADIYTTTFFNNRSPFLLSSLNRAANSPSNGLYI